ncbi:unnamed protein product, partial [Gongylonema pulchrum]|uniref:DUF1604 domain-containing protein n=1 Tax=Gongylonema pulchrum TaxID=637853 RepID=A0A183D7F3_9BILA
FHEFCCPIWNGEKPAGGKEVVVSRSCTQNKIMAVFYGTELEELDDEKSGISNKRPLSIEEQVVTDERGRRRFHGAFTGGFSAGYFNTVGSKEGWEPKQFRSSRSERSEKFDYKPEDFMDEEVHFLLIISV